MLSNGGEGDPAAESWTCTWKLLAWLWASPQAVSVNSVNWNRNWLKWIS